MSIFEVGRVFDGYDVDVGTASWAGDVLSVSGDVFLGAVSAANRPKVAAVFRDRFTTLFAPTDEQSVPVIWSEDSTVDGYYRPTGNGTVQASPATLNDGYMAWSIDLQRVGRGALPQTEVLATYGLVPNGLSVSGSVINTSGEVYLSGVPSSAYDSWNGITAAAGATRTTETGAIKSFDSPGVAPAILPSQLIHRFSVDPDDAYTGACSVVGGYAGLTSQLCLGRSMSPDVDGILISNGLVRATIASNVLVVQVYDTGAWVTVGPASWTIDGATSGAATVVTWSTTARASILRNSPEEVTVRMLASSPPAEFGRVWLDATVKRGSRVVTFAVRADQLSKWTVAASTATASTSINGGLRQTANDGNGNRFLMLGGPNVAVISAANGKIGQTTSVNRSFVFGIGSELDGSSATGNNVAQKVAYEFFTGRSEVQRLVAR